MIWCFVSDIQQCWSCFVSDIQQWWSCFVSDIQQWWSCFVSNIFVDAVAALWNVYEKMLLMVMLVSKKKWCTCRETQFTLSAASETTDVSRYVQPANTDRYAFVRRVWGLVLVAWRHWRQYKCPMSGRVLSDFRNGMSGERLTAMQMYPRNCNVCSMLRRLKDLMFCLTFWSGKSNVSRMPMNFGFTMNGFGHQSVMWMERIQRPLNTN